MELVIIKNKYYSYSFVKWLTNVVRMEVMSNLRLDLLPRYEQEIYNLFNVNVNYVDVIKQALNNLQILDSNNKYIVQINSNIKYKNTNLCLNTLVNVLDYGTLQIKGSYLFSNVFNNVSNNMDSYYDRYNPFLRRFNYVY